MLGRLPLAPLLVLSLLVESFGIPATGDDKQFREAPLTPATLEDSDSVPLLLRFPIEASLPESLVGSGHTVEKKVGEIRIDLEGTGRLSGALSKPQQVVTVHNKAVPIQVLIFRINGDWFAAPASVLRGKLDKNSVEILDADCDGNFGSKGDWIRLGTGTFFHVSKAMLLGNDKLLVNYDIPSGGKPRIRWQPLARPDWANDAQWIALMESNERRNRNGLEPMTLDEDRCKGCQLHAKYLELNHYDYSKPWDGVGSHEELPGSPGFTEEGRKAAHENDTAGGSDTGLLVNNLFNSMLHRLSFLGPPNLGVGVAIASSGYTVIGGPLPEIEDFKDVILVPAPGAQETPLTIHDERPAPERIPDFYAKPRGYPISVTIGRVSATDFSMELWTSKKRKVSGELFTPLKPVHSTRPENGGTVFFVPDEALAAHEEYEVRFQCKLKDGPKSITWKFRTV